MNRTPKMYEREEDFDNYVKMAAKKPEIATALLLREQDDARDRDEAYRKMDGERHQELKEEVAAISKTYAEHCINPDAHHPAPTRRDGSGGKVVVNVEKVKEEAPTDGVEIKTKLSWGTVGKVVGVVVALVLMATGINIMGG